MVDGGSKMKAEADEIDCSKVPRDLSKDLQRRCDERLIASSKNV